MEQIIYLEADDDISTIRERLSRSQADRVFLVAPARLQIFRNLVNLRLLQRYGEQFGVDLTLVSSDGTTRSLAREVKLPVRSALRNGPAQPARSDRGQRQASGTPAILSEVRRGRLATMRPPAAASTGRRIFGYLLLLVAVVVVIGAALLLAPEATVELTPAMETLSQRLAVKAGTDVRSVDTTKGQIPARLIQTSLEDSAQADSTGRKQSPTQRATGRVVFTNRGAGTVNVPQGTAVRTGTGSQTRFFTTAAATVAPNAFTQVPIEAEMAGSGGNLPAWSISQVEGSLSFQLSVINDTPTSGGGEAQAQLVTPADRQMLHDSLLARIKASAQEAVRRDLKPTETLLEGSLVIRVEDESFDREANEVSKSVGLRMRVGASALAVPTDALGKLAESALEASQSDGSTMVPKSIKVGAPTDVQMDGLGAAFKLDVSAVSVVGLDTTQVQRDIQGLTVAEAGRLLAKRYRLNRDPDITLSNGWLGRLPLIAFRIHVKTTS